MKALAAITEVAIATIWTVMWVGVFLWLGTGERAAFQYILNLLVK